MNTFMQSIVPSYNYHTPIQTTDNKRQIYQRYSSLDDSYYSKLQLTQRSPTLLDSKQDKKPQIQKQRVHSQKKLSLTTPNSNTCINQNNNNHNSTLNIAKQAYEGFKKNFHLSSNTKGTLLQKRGKHTVTYNTNLIKKFPQSTTSIQLETLSYPIEKQNFTRTMNSFDFKNKSRSKGLIEPTDHNTQPNFYTVSTQPTITGIYTAPQSPTCSVSTPKAFTSFEAQIISSTQISVNDQFNSLKQLFSSQLFNYKQQTNKTLFQNSMKIKQLESLLFQNKQQIEQKDFKIRQLEAKLAKHDLKNCQNINQKSSLKNLLSVSRNEQNTSYLSSKIDDLQKRISIISNFTESSQQTLNSRLDIISTLMMSIMSTRFFNIKFTLKDFISRIQRNIGEIQDKVGKINIKKENREKCELFEICDKLVDHARGMGKMIVHEKIDDDMKTTLHSSTHKPKTQILLESRDISESFWQNLEDYPLPIVPHDASFTDDSFSYANIKHQTQSNSEFPLGSFPSFSKFSIDLAINKESLQSIKNSMAQSALENSSSFLFTIEQIYKSRQSSLVVFVDENNYIRYKGSYSCIFDKKGNMLKPTRQQISTCLARKWITFV